MKGSFFMYVYSKENPKCPFCGSYFDYDIGHVTKFCIGFRIPINPCFNGSFQDPRPFKLEDGGNLHRSYRIIRCDNCSKRVELLAEYTKNTIMFEDHITYRDLAFFPAGTLSNETIASYMKINGAIPPFFCPSCSHRIYYKHFFNHTYLNTERIILNPHKHNGKEIMNPEKLTCKLISRILTTERCYRCMNDIICLIELVDCCNGNDSYYTYFKPFAPNTLSNKEYCEWLQIEMDEFLSRPYLFHKKRLPKGI